MIYPVRNDLKGRIFAVGKNIKALSSQTGIAYPRLIRLLSGFALARPDENTMISRVISEWEMAETAKEPV